MADSKKELDEVEKSLAGEISLLAARETWRGIKGGVSSLVEDVLGFAERKLDSEKSIRGLREPLTGREAAAPAVENAPSEVEVSPNTELAVERARVTAREDRARKELDLLKAALARGESIKPRPEPEPERALSRYELERLEREQRARLEMETIKRSLGKEPSPTVSGEESPQGEGARPAHDPAVRRSL